MIIMSKGRIDIEQINLTQTKGRSLITQKRKMTSSMKLLTMMKARKLFMLL